MSEALIFGGIALWVLGYTLDLFRKRKSVEQEQKEAEELADDLRFEERLQEWKEKQAERAAVKAYLETGDL
jgi:membrane protein YqaA with SNARE-associated domain